MSVAMYSSTSWRSSGVISVTLTPFCSDRAVRPALPKHRHTHTHHADTTRVSGEVGLEVGVGG